MVFLRRNIVSLHAFNLTTSEITVPVINFDLPPSVLAGRRGSSVNLTAEMWPDLTADPVYGKVGGLSPANFATIQALVASGDIEFEWVTSKDYDTASLDVLSSVVPAITSPGPNLIPRSNSEGVIDSGWTSINRCITVGKGGSVDYNSVKEACDYIASVGDATVSNPYTVLIYPGEYEEDPFEIPNHVSLSGIGQARRQRIVPTNNSSNFITVTGESGIYDVVLYGPSGVGFATVYSDTDGSLINIRNVGFGSGYYGVHICPPTSRAILNIQKTCHHVLRMGKNLCGYLAGEGNLSSG